MNQNRNIGKTKYNVGDWVTFLMYPTRGLAQVIERRGPLGRGGEQVYRIRHDADWGEVREFEQSESGLEPADPPANGIPPALK